jgi:hypothetical protein
VRRGGGARKEEGEGVHGAASAGAWDRRGTEVAVEWRESRSPSVPVAVGSAAPSHTCTCRGREHWAIPIQIFTFNSVE